MTIALDVKSHYSFLSSTLSIPSYVKEGKERGYRTLALADDHSMMGAIEFYQSCQMEEINPILGLRMALSVQSIVPEVLLTLPFLIFAKNEKGYRDLLEIASGSDEALFSKWMGQDVYSTENSAFIINLTHELSQQSFERLGNYFEQRQKSLYIGLDPFLLREEYISHIQNAFSQWVYVKPIAMRKLRYLKANDGPALSVLHAIKRSEEVNIQQLSPGNDYLREPKDLEHIFDSPILEKARINLENLLEECHVTIPLHQQLLPRFFKEDQSHELASQKLRALCQKALVLKNCQSKDYQERLDMELSVIDSMGFSDYFLIVWDIMRYARESKIITSPGRGSAAGALVTYLLDITTIDPLKNHLLFERFLNKDRRTMPDIDLDFPDLRREEILRYVLHKYGREHVAQISTVGTFQVRQALRDVGRVAGLQAKDLNQLTKQVPNRLGITLLEAFKESVGLRRLAEQSPYKEILGIAKKIEGLARHPSTHAAGVILSEAPLIHYTALFQKEAEQLSVSQLQMRDIEQVGLLKIDFLGLRNLTTVELTLKAINRKKTFALQDIPMNDKECFHLFQEGDTTGIFQFESDGIRRVLKGMCPESIEDLTAVNALYRPGPMEQISTFIERKKGKKPIEYVHPLLEPILSSTYGIMVYQEQVMQVAQAVAGFSLAQADLLRRAMSKKKHDLIAKQKKSFLSGALKKGLTEEEAEKIFQFIEQFANYGFNRSHAMVYSLLAYQMAYLKCHYPLEFYAALLESVSLKSDKGRLYIAEMRRRSLQIKGPDLNSSSLTDSIDGEAICMGLANIKRLPRELMERLISHRKEFGPYKQLEDVVLAAGKKFLNASYFEALILSGSLDFLGETRQSLLETLPSILQHVSFFGYQLNLLEDDPEMSITYSHAEEMPLLKRLENELEYLGLMVTQNPVSPYQQMAKDEKWGTLLEISSKKANYSEWALFTLHQIERIKTKTGELMAFLVISDQGCLTQAIVFPKLYYRWMSLLKEGQVYLGKFKVGQSKGREKSLSLQEVSDINEVEKVYKAKHTTLYINLLPENEGKVNQIRRLIYNNRGQTPVVFVKQPQRMAFRDPKLSHVFLSQSLINELKRLIGDENIRIQ